MLLVNRINRRILKENLKNEPFQRRTLSFYKYTSINDPIKFRDYLFQDWQFLGCYGRVYVAKEGINAQMSVPEFNLAAFCQYLLKYPELNGVSIKYAVEDNGKSFYKLTIKVRPKIVADGLADHIPDMSKTGLHLTPLEFHSAIEDPEAIIVDMRNHYESEIGKFSGAWCPDADTFKEALQIVATEFQNQKNRKLLLYCTGGIRCEKASAYLIYLGYKNVFQLSGGIIAYANYVKENKIPSKFTGKNFVFDDRLGESVNGQMISTCHQCGSPCDTHINCANNDCHLLFIQCNSCREKYAGCCSVDCRNIQFLPPEDRKKFKILRKSKYARSKIFNKMI